MPFRRSREVPLIDAWGAYDEQYPLADFLHYQQQLDFDLAVSEEQRLARWEDRLLWEELDDVSLVRVVSHLGYSRSCCWCLHAERKIRYSETDEYERMRLGLAGQPASSCADAELHKNAETHFISFHHPGGWYGYRFGGTPFDLGYLRNVSLSLGLFAPRYRGLFCRHGRLRRRFSPYYSRILGYDAPPRYPARPVWGAPYGSRPLSVGPSLRIQELRERLRIAETRGELPPFSIVAFSRLNLSDRSS